jgi:hypothetical protein
MCVSLPGQNTSSYVENALVLDPNFDPYKILQDLADNQVRITDEMKLFAQRINQLNQMVYTQQKTIDHLISATQQNTQLTQDILKWQNHK